VELRYKIILLLMILVVAISGCESHKSNNELVLAVPGWYSPENIEPLKKAIEDWRIKHPDLIISVKILFGKKDSIKQKIYLGAGRTDFADAILVRNQWIPSLANSGLIKNISPDISSAIEDKTLPAISKSICESGKCRAIPFDCDVLLFRYRKDILKKYNMEGALISTDAMLLVTKELLKGEERKGHMYGFAFPGAHSVNSAIHFLPWYFSFGGKLINEKGELSLDRKIVGKTLKWIKAMIKSEACPDNLLALEQSSIFSGLAGGQYAMTVSGNWERKMLDSKSDLSGKIASAHIPFGEDGKSSSLVGGWSFVLTKYSDEKKIVPFLLTLFNENHQREKLYKNSLLPVFVSLLEDPWFESNIDGPVIKAGMENGRSLPFSKNIGTFLEDVSVMLAKVLLEEKER